MIRYYVAAGYDLRISNMLDIDGDETDDPDEAASIVAELPDGWWLAIECHFGDIVERPAS